MDLIKWHKSLVEKIQKELGISNYSLYWFGFIEGAIVMWVILKVFTLFMNRSELPIY